MAKRVREDEPSKVVTEERGAKRHASGALPENYQHAVPGWEPLSASKQQLLVPTAAHAAAQGEPLRPANQSPVLGQAAVAASAAAAGAAALPAADAVAGPGHTLEHAQLKQQVAVSAAASAAAMSIDWHNPEQVAQLLRMLHVERLHRHGQQLPPEYQQQQQQQQHLQ